MFSIIKVLLILLKHAGEIPTNDQLRRAGLEPVHPEPRMPYPSPLVLRHRHHRHHWVRRRRSSSARPSTFLQAP